MLAGGNRGAWSNRRPSSARRASASLLVAADDVLHRAEDVGDLFAEVEAIAGEDVPLSE